MASGTIARAFADAVNDGRHREAAALFSVDGGLIRRLEVAAAPG